MTRVKLLSSAVALAAILSAPSLGLAQRGGSRAGGGGGGFRGGGGGGGFRGGGGGGGFRGGGFSGGHVGGVSRGFVGGGGFRGGFVGHGGFVNRGFVGHGGFVNRGFGGFRSRPFFGRSVFASSFYYGYPGFGFYSDFGYPWYSSYYPPYAYYPSEPYYPPASYYPSSPSVVVVDSGGYRDRVEYREPYREPPAPSPRGVVRESYWLVALRDKNIVAVSDYWMEGSTLHYVTREGRKESADISSVDVPFTKELNAERGLEFRLPSSQYGPRRLDSFGRPD